MSANTKYVQVPFPVPRDPSEYRATDHIQQRQRYRVPEEIRGRVIGECITDGHCKGTTPPDNADPGDVRQCFAFEKRVDGTPWRVVVGIREIAFRDPARKHLALTVMEVHDD